MLKLVWDTSALVNIKQPNNDGYSPGHSLWKDLADGLHEGLHQNLLVAISVFETQASVSRLNREGSKVGHEFWILDDHTKIYPVDEKLVQRSAVLFRAAGFDQLRGADLIFACVAKLEDAWLVTLDKHFQKVAEAIKVLDLRESLTEARYRETLGI